MSLEVLLVFVFVLNVLFHFNNFTYSFEDPQEMQVLYQMFLLNSGEFDKKLPICYIPINKWKCYCGYVMKALRKENEFQDIYPNYAAFMEGSPMCEKITLELPNGSTVENQFIVNCYGRESVVLKTTFPLFYKHFKEIAFYRSTLWEGLFIFKRKQNTDIYLLLHIKKDFRTSHISCKPEMLNYPPPQATPLTYLSENLNADDLRSAKALLLRSDNIHRHILRNVHLHGLLRICTLVYGQEKFRSEFIVSSNPKDYEYSKPINKYYKIILRTPDKTVTRQISVYNCHGHTSAGELTLSYVISEGNKEYTVILSKIIQDDIVQPLEMIENVNYPNLPEIDFVT